MPREAAWKVQDAFLGPADWGRAHRAAAIAEATGCTLREAAAIVAALPLRRSDWYGSSVEFDEWVRDEKPWLRAPESAAVPLAGVPGWSPEHEDPHAAFCPDCRRPRDRRPRGAAAAAVALHEVRPVDRPAERPVLPQVRGLGL
jgi:hypothetical protein